MLNWKSSSTRRPSECFAPHAQPRWLQLLQSASAAGFRDHQQAAKLTRKTEKKLREVMLQAEDERRQSEISKDEASRITRRLFFNIFFLTLRPTLFVTVEFDVRVSPLCR